MRKQQVKPNAQKGRFVPGDKVIHMEYGFGTVLENVSNEYAELYDVSYRLSNFTSSGDLLSFAYVPSVLAFINKVRETFPKSFINRDNELILEPKNNLYFRLDGIQSEQKLKEKMLTWLSRPISKGLSPHWSKKMLVCFNEVMETNFTKTQMEVIYTALGNDVNSELAIQFIESGYDMSLLELHHWHDAQGAALAATENQLTQLEVSV